MQVKIYDYNNTPITTLNALDFEALEYENQIDGDGFCEFTCRNDNPKLTQNSVEMYNRVRIYEGSTCKFSGYISDNAYSLNTVKIRAVSLSNLLKKRLNSMSVINGDIATMITQLINNMNAYDPTGISIGGITLNYNVNKTYGADTLEYVISDLKGNAQMYIDPLGKLYIKDIIGEDKSNTVRFNYDTRKIQASNLLSFSVKEDGENITTEVVGKDNSNNSVVVQNSSLKAKYGVIQALKTYSTVSGTQALTIEAEKDLADRTFSPELSLKPDINDNFDVGDIVKVRIYNKFIDVDTNYQILVKSVKYIGSQKQIKIKVNDKVKSILDVLKAQEDRIRQLEK